MGRTLAGRFALVSQLGQGAMGTVWRATDLHVGRDVAVKLVLEGTGRAERLLREAQLAARLDHPGVVRVHAAGQDEGRPWIALELVEGARTLGAVFKELPLRERVELVRDAALALGHAHARGVVHRDVKPDNILVDAQGRVRVTDFGLAAAADLERLTRTGAAIGTPAFMAPEQLGGGTIGPPADVWGLGGVLYEALTGELPFEADDLASLVARVARADVVPPRRLDPAIPRALELVCLRALSRSPDARYPDAGAFAAALEAALARGHRHRGPLLAVAGAGALLVAALVAVCVKAGGSEAAQRVAVEPAAPEVPTASALVAPAPPAAPPPTPLTIVYEPGQRLRWTLRWGTAGTLERVEYRVKLALTVDGVGLGDDQAAVRLVARMEALAVETTSWRWDSETAGPDDLPLFRDMLLRIQRDVVVGVHPPTGDVAVRSVKPFDVAAVREAIGRANELVVVINVVAGELNDAGLRRTLENCLRIPTPPGGGATWTHPDLPLFAGGGEDRVRGDAVCRLDPTPGDRTRRMLSARLSGQLRRASGQVWTGANYTLEAVVRGSSLERSAVRLTLPRAQESSFMASEAWFTLEAAR